MGNHIISNPTKKKNVKRFNSKFWHIIQSRVDTPEFKRFLSNLNNDKLALFIYLRAQVGHYRAIDDMQTQLPRLWSNSGGATVSAKKMNRAAIAHLLNSDVVKDIDFTGFKKAVNFYNGIYIRLTMPVMPTGEARQLPQD